MWPRGHDCLVPAWLVPCGSESRTRLLVPSAVLSLHSHVRARVCAYTHTHHAVFCFSKNDICSGIALPNAVLSFFLCGPITLATEVCALSLCPQCKGKESRGVMGQALWGTRPAPLWGADVLGFMAALAWLSPRCPESFLSPNSIHIRCL